MDEVVCRTKDMKWEELRAFPGRADGQVLREDSATGAKTLLVRVPAGGEIIPHGHRGIVQHFVVEGQYQSQGKDFGPGCYRLMPPNHDVSTITTKAGVTILMIYDPVGM